MFQARPGLARGPAYETDPKPHGPACRHSARTELGAQPTRAREGAVIPEPTGRVSCRVSRANQVAMEGIGKGYGMMAGGLGLAIG